MKSEEVKQVLSELHNIARELNEPFDSANVLCEYSKRNNGYSKEVAEMGTSSRIAPIFSFHKSFVYL